MSDHLAWLNETGLFYFDHLFQLGDQFHGYSVRLPQRIVQILESRSDVAYVETNVRVKTAQQNNQFRLSNERTDSWVV